jgi:hypothetical protein
MQALWPANCAFSERVPIRSIYEGLGPAPGRLISERLVNGTKMVDSSRRVQHRRRSCRDANHPLYAASRALGRVAASDYAAFLRANDKSVEVATYKRIVSDPHRTY